eukprot:CAMPEP_0114376876 /NCGR_PEP_ID=MMETSP0102-20121206/649_1 /TAXON_ID=38822 ORGANISM="Pteridomonas danica, Strain PT" /NCGR_SAMPLE_ID=MMETSP0102 /ASSEMBLY_ACC=CAM_ASM_000212 /LENGTH=408 /DNA_ID=CAMNT_0001531319 /DNA_START=1362 /DNA_END=2588 /DNA_ORIENTATION=-
MVLSSFTTVTTTPTAAAAAAAAAGSPASVVAASVAAAAGSPASVVAASADEHMLETETDVEMDNAPNVRTFGKEKADFMNQSIEPPLVHESVLALKANAAQFMIVFVMSFSLLPFYENGFVWWNEGAQVFLTTMYFPNIQHEFSYWFTWPHFKQPRLSFQLSLGLLVVVLQFVSTIIKQLLFRFDSSLQCQKSQPSVFERKNLNISSILTWSIFRESMDVIQLTLPIWRDEMLSFVSDHFNKFPKQGILTGDFAVWFFIFIGFPIYAVHRFIYLMFTKKRTIKYDKGDVHKLVTLINSEDILRLSKIEIPLLFEKDVFFDYNTFIFIFIKCPWITIRDWKGRIPLNFAVKCNHENAVRAFIDAGFNLNLVDNTRYTALALAIKDGNENIVKLLIDANCDVNAANTVSN